MYLVSESLLDLTESLGEARSEALGEPKTFSFRISIYLNIRKLVFKQVMLIVHLYGNGFVGLKIAGFKGFKGFE